jgi:predicted nucleic acid-binding protein
MPTRVLLDSNVFIFAFERPESNSHRILGKLVAQELLGVVTDRVVREAMGYFRRHYGKNLAGQFRNLIFLTCDIVLEEDLEVPRALRDLVGHKDAGALAAVRTSGLARLVSTDADFEGVPEHRNPRGLLLDLGRRPAVGEE